MPGPERLSCNTCRYADPAILNNVNGATRAVLLCRRHPPTMVSDEDAVGPAWTLVGENDWCGDHAPTPEVAPVTYRWVAHNLIAHPLLVLCPPLGEWLHDRTIPDTPGEP